MNSYYEAPTTLEYFATLVQSDEHLPLLEAAACIAQDEYPELDIQQLLADVDQLISRLRRRMREDMSEVQRLQVLNRFFYGDLGFGGNLNNFYDPENSYINDVLRTRRGIPISLALVWMELAQGIGLQVHGVGFPGHFLVKVSVSEGLVVLDPMTGQSLTRELLSERLVPFRQRMGASGDDEAPLGLFLQAATARDILARMLRNLKEIHLSQKDAVRQLAVLDRLLVLFPDAWSERRDRGLVHAQQGHTQQALADLEAYVAHADQQPDKAEMASQVETLRREARG